jgi:hypothetical protein
VKSEHVQEIIVASMGAGAVKDGAVRASAVYEPVVDTSAETISRPREPTSEGIRIRARSDATLSRIVTHPLLANLWRRPPVVTTLAELSSSFNGADLLRSAIRLAADGALDIEIDGRFVTGPDAVVPLVPNIPLPTPAGRTAALSIDALRHVAALPGLDAGELAGRLYHHGSSPLTPRVRSRLPNAAAVGRFLGIDANSRDPRIGAGWQRSGDSPGWLQWRRPGGMARGRNHKLYVGLGIEDLPDALGSIAAAAAEEGAHAFKVGASAHGLLRPDKLVIYLKSIERMGALARRLATDLAGARVCPVPFTADAGGDGLVSWAVDPQAGSCEAEMGRSWRVWVSRILGDALAVARIAGCREAEPWRFALLRLSLEHVDVGTWRPHRGFGRPRPKDKPACST